jgi:hypothetical protein
MNAQSSQATWLPQWTTYTPEPNVSDYELRILEQLHVAVQNAIGTLHDDGLERANAYLNSRHGVTISWPEAQEDTGCGCA